jgi:hypothetical protein
MPEWMLINSIEADPFHDGGLYVAGTRYKLGDFKPYLYYTSNYGEDWVEITNGIGEEHFTRVIRADKNKKGLLYAGTETGVYVSYNNGANWHSLQLNLPIVPITDLTVKGHDLIVATQGRSLWILDNVHIIQQADNSLLQKSHHLYDPALVYRMDGGQNFKVQGSGVNHAAGLQLHYYMALDPDTCQIDMVITDEKGDTCRHFSKGAKDKINELKIHQGAGIFSWNLSYPAAKTFPGMINFWASMAGPKALPGDYKAIMTVNGRSSSTSFSIKNDPLSNASLADLSRQFDFVKSIRDKLSEVHQTIMDIRALRTQLKQLQPRIKRDSSYLMLRDLGLGIDSSLTSVEKALYQTQNRSPQDPLNFPIRLNNKLGHLNALSYGDYPPTEQALAVRDELFRKIEKNIKQFKQVLKQDVVRFNTLFRQQMVDVIWLEPSN